MTLSEDATTTGSLVNRPRPITGHVGGEGFSLADGSTGRW
jgi:hypothetical protein